MAVYTGPEFAHIYLHDWDESDKHKITFLVVYNRESVLYGKIVKVLTVSNDGDWIHVETIDQNESYFLPAEYFLYPTRNDWSELLDSAGIMRRDLI